MNVLQLIDTLHPGGAERMAVNYANLLAGEEFGAFLITTRQEGVFKDLISEQVTYSFLKKKHALDLRALKRLSNYIEEHSIDLIHAHGTSWFSAVLCKLTKPELKLIWHDHYGNSEFLQNREKSLLRYFSKYFDGIISVNEELKNWSLQHLRCKNVIKLKNFVYLSAFRDAGMAKKSKHAVFKIVCLANFREQKDHSTLFRACDRIKDEFNIELHLIGKEFNSEYSKKVRLEAERRDYVILHGETLDPFSLLKQMDLGVLSSKSEGLPIAVLEYGLAGLLVIGTRVGELENLLDVHGILVEPGNPKELSAAIAKLIQEESPMKIQAAAFQEKIVQEYSQKAIFRYYKNFISNL